MRVKFVNQNRLKRAAYRQVTGLAIVGLLSSLAIAAGPPAQATAPLRAAVRPRLAAGTPARQRAVIRHETSPWIGSDVVLSGTTAVIGDASANNNTGTVYVYGYSAHSWNKLATLPDPRDAQDDYFGSNVAISVTKTVTYLAVGDPTGNIVYVYAGSSGAFHLQQTIKDPGTSSEDDFGDGLAIAGRTLVIGSPFARDGDGYAYIYSLSGSHWTRQARLEDLGDTSLDEFGKKKKRKLKT